MLVGESQTFLLRQLMDIALSETQKLIRDSVRDYLRQKVSFDRIRHLESNGGYDQELWHYLHESGFLALPFAAKFGGSGSLVDLGILVEQLTRRAVVVPFVETLTSAICIERFGDRALAEEVVTGVIEGSLRLSPALLERDDRYDHPSIRFEGGVISGMKYFVDYGQVATHHLVSVVEAGRPALVLVAVHPTRVSQRQLHNISRLPQANVTYDRVPARKVGGPEALTFLFRLNQVLAAVQCLGNAQEALDMTVGYVAMRVQFGRPIGTFQAVQHHCANMATMVEACRFLAFEALWWLAEDKSDDRQLAVAKNWAAKTVTEVTMLAHQLHGGIGVTEDYDLHFFTRRGKDRAVAWGSADETIRHLAKTIEEPNRWH
jgi:3-oxocholest-4-en-26-oyl-CoA dehydrogenase beta subunit